MLLSTHAHANLCDSIKDATTTAETKNDVNFYEELFPDTEHHGNRRWNEIVVQCNRQRDTKGDDVRKATASNSNNAEKQLLKTSNLDTKVIRGHYNFFGTIVTQLKYVYALSKKNGVWTMVIPYKAEINDLVADRVDFDADSGAHAWQLYDASQVVNPSAKVLTLKTSPQPIAKTLCSSSTYFPGDKGKYDGMNGANAYKRDKENKFISLGKIQYFYKDENYLAEGCRVNKNRDLYWREDPKGEVVKVKPQDWILDNFVRTAESYWTIPGTFQLKLLMKGRNDSSFPESTLDLLQDDDHLTVHFATKFMPYGGNQMYKSNIIQFNNFSTMTTDGTYWHEVGHAFGLDDEYANKQEDKDNCKNSDYASYSPLTYQMCQAGGSDSNKKTIYHYLAVSRYITKQKECSKDTDCSEGEYCNAGADLTKNSCEPLKNDNESCAAVGGGHQCKGGQCKFARCYTPNSVAMGGTCYVNDACKEGKCSSLDGTKGTCVCKEDSDCGTGKYCDAGVDTKVNACRPKLDKGESCAGVAGNDHKCKSGECSGFPKYVCK